jgi:hypothetical protein
MLVEIFKLLYGFKWSHDLETNGGGGQFYMVVCGYGGGGN